MRGVERVAALTGTISRGRQGPSRLTRVPSGPEEGRVGKGKGAVETQRASPGSTLTKPGLSLHLPGPVQSSSVQFSRSVMSESLSRLCDVN